MMAPGRFCPADYRYAPASFAHMADLHAETIYVVGGLYGNSLALDTIEHMAGGENGAVDIVFNGDFHWLDATQERFANISRRVAAHHCLRGNVETELARASDIGAGCGCGYPASVDSGTVERSNRILAELRQCVGTLPGERQRLAALSMTLVVAINGVRIGVVHGDAESLAGWRFSSDALDAGEARAWLGDIRVASRIDVFASSHTCVPGLRDFALDSGRLTIINNGAAGMPNFRATTFGVITRIGRGPSPHQPLYGVERDGVFIEALPVHYDQSRWLYEFSKDWPPGSSAYESYFPRLVSGPAFSLDDAVGRFSAGAIARELTR